MRSPAIKICGISSPDILEAVIAARGDFIGLVFYAPSPRHVSLARAAELGARAAGRVGRVGLFVNTPVLEIAAAVDAAGLDAIQLHGAESPAQVAAIRQRFALPVWKVLTIAEAADLDKVARYSKVADLALLDAKTPAGALPGGMGLTFDWNLLSGWHAPCPWGLAGGLSAANVGTALRQTAAPLIDASSGVENAPGIKDASMIADFCKAARNF